MAELSGPLALAVGVGLSVALGCFCCCSGVALGYVTWDRLYIGKYILYNRLCIISVIIWLLIFYRAVIEWLYVGNVIENATVYLIYEISLWFFHSIGVNLLTIYVWLFYFGYYLQLCSFNEATMISVNETHNNWFYHTANTYGNPTWLVKRGTKASVFLYLVIVGIILPGVDYVINGSFLDVTLYYFLIPRIISIIFSGIACYMTFFAYKRLELFSIIRFLRNSQLIGLGIVLVFFEISLILDTLGYIFEFQKFFYDKYDITRYFGLLHLIPLGILYIGAVKIVEIIPAFNSTITLVLMMEHFEKRKLEIESKKKGKNSKNSEKKEKAKEMSLAEKQAKRLAGLTENQIKCVKDMEKYWYNFIQTQEAYILFHEFLIGACSIELLAFVVELVQIKHCYRVSHGNMLKLPNSAEYYKNWPQMNNLDEYVNDHWTDKNWYYVLDFNGDVVPSTVQSECLALDGLKMSNIGDKLCCSSGNKNSNDNDNGTDNDTDNGHIEQENEVAIAFGINDRFDEKKYVSYASSHSNHGIHGIHGIHGHNSTNISININSNDKHHNHNNNSSLNINMASSDANDMKTDSVEMALQVSTPVIAGMTMATNDDDNDNNGGNNNNNNNTTNNTNNLFGKHLGGLDATLPVSFAKNGHGNASSISQYSDGVISQAHSLDEQKTQHGHGIDGMNNSTIMKTVSLTDAYHPPMTPVETVVDPNMITKLHSIKTIDDYMNELNSDKKRMIIGSKRRIRVKSAFFTNTGEGKYIKIITLPCGIPLSRELCNNHTLYDQMAGIYKKYVNNHGSLQINLAGHGFKYADAFFARSRQYAANLIQLSNNNNNNNNNNDNSIAAANEIENDRKENDDNNVVLELGTTNTAVVASLGDKRVNVPQSIASPSIDTRDDNNNNTNNNRSMKNVEILEQTIQIDSEMNIKDLKLSKATDVYLSKLNRMAFNIFDDAFKEVNQLLRDQFNQFRYTPQYDHYLNFVVSKLKLKNELMTRQSDNEQFKQSIKYKMPYDNTLQVHELAKIQK